MFGAIKRTSVTSSERRRRPKNDMERHNTAQTAQQRCLAKAFALKEHVIGNCLKAKNFSHLFVNGVRFSMKKHSEKENLKTGMLLGSSFFQRKSISKKAVPRRTPRFEVFTPNRHQDFTRAFQEALRCGWSVMMSDDDASDIYIRLLSSRRTLIAKAIGNNKNYFVFATPPPPTPPNTN